MSQCPFCGGEIPTHCIEVVDLVDNPAHPDWEVVPWMWLDLRYDWHDSKPSEHRTIGDLLAYHPPGKFSK